MKRFLVCLTLLLAVPAGATDWSPAQQQVLAAIARLSAATAPDGGGADAYAAVLADDFSRWTVGSDKLQTKQSWVDGMREWFDIGWRVTDREQTVLEITVDDRFAFTRRIVAETYTGPRGDITNSKAALAETWVRGDGGEWLLLRVNISVMES